MTGEQQLFHLIEEARRRHVLDQWREFRDGSSGLYLDGQTEFRRQSRCAKHAHRILAVARQGIADEAQAPSLHVGHSADIVPDAFGRRVEVQRVDGEITAYGVLSLSAE